jgi:hypothetical protein
MWSELKALILALAAMLVLLAIFMIIRVWVLGQSDVSACKMSMQLNSVKIGADVGTRVEAEQGLTGIKCPKTVLHIKGSMSEETAKAAIAEKMRECYYKVGGGTSVPFQNKILYQGTNTYCILCTSVIVDESYKKQHETLQGFNEYLNETKMPDSKLTYAEYLTSAEKFTSIKLTGQDQSDSYSLNEDYVILFTLTKNPQYVTWLRDTSRMAATIPDLTNLQATKGMYALTYILTDPNKQASVSFIPQRALEDPQNKVCEALFQ